MQDLFTLSDECPGGPSEAGKPTQAQDKWPQLERSASLWKRQWVECSGHSFELVHKWETQML